MSVRKRQKIQKLLREILADFPRLQPERKIGQRREPADRKLSNGVLSSNLSRIIKNIIRYPLQFTKSKLQGIFDEKKRDSLECVFEEVNSRIFLIYFRYAFCVFPVRFELISAIIFRKQSEYQYLWKNL